MAEACRAFDLPVVGRQRQPLQREPRPRHRPDAGRGRARASWTASTSGRPGSGSWTAASLVVLGPETRSLAGSRWAWERGHKAGAVPALDLEAHAALVALVRTLVVDGRVSGVHDAADGLGVALAEMAVRSGKGFRVSANGADHALAVRRVGQPGGRVRGQRPRRRGAAGRAGGRRARRRASAWPAATGSWWRASSTWRSTTPSPPGGAACPTPSAPAPPTSDQSTSASSRSRRAGASTVVVRRSCQRCGPARPRPGRR